MPRVHVIHTNFTAGEFSPLLEGRIDIDKYTNAVKELKNMVIMPHGGVTRRGGWHYVDDTKYHDKTSRLIPFEYSSVQAYMIELGDLYARFYMNGYQIKVQSGSDLITNGTFGSDITGWTDKSVAPGTITWEVDHMDLNGGATGIGWAQQGITTVIGTEYCIKCDVATNTLKIRIGSTNGGQEILVDTVVSIGTDHDIIFTATTTTTYIGFRRDANGGADLDNVNCKEWIPYELVTPYHEDDLPNIQYGQTAEDLYLVHPLIIPQKITRVAHDDWSILPIFFTDGPYFDEEVVPTITPTWAGPSVEKVANGGFDTDVSWVKGANWTISGGVASKSAGAANDLSQDTSEAAAEIYRIIYTIVSISGGNLTMSIGGVAGTARSAAGTYAEFITATGAGDLTFTPSAAGVVCSIDNVFVHRVSALNASTDVWSSDHVDAYWRIKQGTTWGWCLIVKWNSSTQVLAYVFSDIGSDAAEGWREGSWCDHNGWPCAITFHEDRLVFAGTGQQPQTFWGSKAGEYTNFTPGVNDDDAYYYTLGSGKIDLIRWLCSSKVLLIGTMGSEYSAKGGSDAAITPNNINVKLESTYGSATHQPLRIGHAVLFIQRAGCKIRELAYNWEDESYSAPDLTLLAEHLTLGGIGGLSYQQEPYSIVWAHTLNGLCLGMTYERTQNIVGWHQHPTDGLVESIAVIPDPLMLEDQVWAIIKRTVGGAPKRFVEYLDPANDTDCSLNYSGTAVTAVSGAGHLLGRIVKIVGDGAVYPDAIVQAGGIVTLDGPAAMEIEIGLGYDSKILSLRPEVPTGAGTSMGIQKHWSKVVVRLFESIGVTINGELVEFRTSDDEMDEGLDVFTGDKSVSNLGCDKDARITIEQLQPLPLTIICFFGVIDVGD